MRFETIKSIILLTKTRTIKTNLTICMCELQLIEVSSLQEKFIQCNTIGMEVFENRHDIMI